MQLMQKCELLFRAILKKLQELGTPKIVTKSECLVPRHTVTPLGRRCTCCAQRGVQGAPRAIQQGIRAARCMQR